VTIVAAIAALVWVVSTPLRVLAWVALPVGIFSYVIMGHAFMYSPFLWAVLLRDLVRRGGPKA
jgi:hypothetical protein